MKNVLLLFLAMSVSVVLYGQRTVSGTVTNVDGEPLIGANVTVVGEDGYGTITDFDGFFELQVPESAEMLDVSYIGYQATEIKLGDADEYNVLLEDSGVALDEVVVTAMGVERESRELGYAVSTIDGTTLAQTRTSNVIGNLSGRVAGVRVNASSGTAGGSVNIQIRGLNSLGGGNQPLFVVDGVPISNSSFNGSRSDIISGGADVGNRAADLNPDDIEKMTILKGSSAVALYGQRARDGVVMVTTKRGKKSGINVEYNTSIRASNAFRLPDFQNEYATGSFGEYDANNFTNGWGPKISTINGISDEINAFPFDEPVSSLQAQPDNVKDFFRTGVTFINNIAVSSRSEKGDIRVSFTNHSEEGIVPGNELNKNVISINGGSSLNERLRVRGVANYVRTEGLNRPRQGSNNPNILMSSVYGLPRTVDNNTLKNNTVDPMGMTIGLNGNNTENNPYYIVENNPFNNIVDRVYGNVEATLDITKWWNVMGRMGTDFFQENRRNISSKGTVNLQNGQFIDQSIYRREVNTDIISRFKFKLTDDLKLNALAGWNVNQIGIERTRLVANDLVVSNLYNPANASSINGERFESLRRLYGGYADIGFNFKDYLYVNFTGRQDWSSTLPKANNSYFYPGVSSSFIFTDALNINESVLSFGKLRASWANVGSDVGPYQLDFLFTPASDIFTQFVPDNTLPHAGQSVFRGPTSLPAGPILRPQNQATFEVGTELQFFKGRFGIDFSYYNTLTSDQIVNVSVAQSTGFESILLNSGEIRNSGVEALVTLSPLSPESEFQWNIIANFTRNRQKVETLAEGLDDLGLTSGFSGLSIRAEEGESFGLYGAGWAKSPTGDIVINQSTGLRERGDRERLGNILPDYQWGVENVFSFKGITLSVLVDASVGGVMFSRTVSSIRGAGLAEETLENRGQTFVDNGVNRVTVDGEEMFIENQTPVRSMQDFWSNYTDNSNTEGSIFDASYIKLREIALSYSLPKRWIPEQSYIKGVSIGFEGRNLWLIDSEVPHIDPEASFFGPSLIGGAANIEFFSVPSMRTFGGNVKVRF